MIITIFYTAAPLVGGRVLGAGVVGSGRPGSKKWKHTLQIVLYQDLSLNFHIQIPATLT